MPVTLNFGMSMPSWYDIISLESEDNEDHENIRKSSLYRSFVFILFCIFLVTELIQNEISNGIPSQNILIGGFSQGGVVSLYNFLTTDLKLGGGIILSGYLPMAEDFVEKKV